MKRRPGMILVALLLLLLAVHAYAQVGRGLLGWNTSPTVLMLWQVEIGTLALGAAIGTWLTRRWAPVVIVLYGASAGMMTVALQPILGLPQDALTGLLLEGGAVLAACLLLAWFVRRSPPGVEPDRD